MSVGTLGEDKATPIGQRGGRAAFRETPLQTLQRWANAVGYRLNPERAWNAPHLLLATASALAARPALPDLAHMRAAPDGFAGLVRDLDPSSLLEAHARGFFVHGHMGPQKWWSPPERAVLMLREARMPKRARGLLRNSGFTVTVDTAFDEVIAACARPRCGRYLTWLTPRILHAYAGLADAGHAHSIEVRDNSGALAGGLFGVATGRVFSVLSMFHTQNHASKIGLICLHHELARRGFVAADFQFMKPIVEQLGYRNMPRAEFHAMMEAHARRGPDLPWAGRIDPAEVAASAAAPDRPVIEPPGDLGRIVLGAGLVTGLALCGTLLAPDGDTIQQIFRALPDARRLALAGA